MFVAAILFAILLTWLGLWAEDHGGHYQRQRGKHDLCQARARAAMRPVWKW